MAFRPSRFIGLVIFAEYPHCHPGSLRGVQKRFSRSCPKIPGSFCELVCSLSWWCNVDWVIEPYLKSWLLCTRSSSADHSFVSIFLHPKYSASGVWEYSVLSELRWREHGLTRFYLLVYSAAACNLSFSSSPSETWTVAHYRTRFIWKHTCHIRPSSFPSRRLILITLVQAIVWTNRLAKAKICFERTNDN